MKELCFFLVRKTSEYYTVVVEGTVDEVYTELAVFFPEVRFIKTEPLDAECASKFVGDRPLGHCTIKGCYFTREFTRKGNPLTADKDPRYTYEAEVA